MPDPLRVVIVDDEPPARAVVREYVERLSDVTIVAPSTFPAANCALALSIKLSRSDTLNRAEAARVSRPSHETGSDQR